MGGGDSQFRGRRHFGIVFFYQEQDRSFPDPEEVHSTLQCIFLSMRLRETRAGSQGEPGGGIHATS